MPGSTTLSCVGTKKTALHKSSSDLFVIYCSCEEECSMLDNTDIISMMYKL